MTLPQAVFAGCALLAAVLAADRILPQAQAQLGTSPVTAGTQAVVAGERLWWVERRVTDARVYMCVPTGDGPTCSHVDIQR